MYIPVGISESLGANENLRFVQIGKFGFSEIAPAKLFGCTNHITGYIWIIVKDLFAQTGMRKPVCVNGMSV